MPGVDGVFGRRFATFEEWLAVISEDFPEFCLVDGDTFSFVIALQDGHRMVGAYSFQDEKGMDMSLSASIRSFTKGKCWNMRWVGEDGGAV